MIRSWVELSYKFGYSTDGEVNALKGEGRAGNWQLQHLLVEGWVLVGILKELLYCRGHISCGVTRLMGVNPKPPPLIAS